MGMTISEGVAQDPDYPAEWRILTIQDAAANTSNAIVGGPFGSDLVSADYVANGVPVIRGQNMSGKFVDGEFAFVSQKKAKALVANLARSGDLIFTQRGTLGQVAIVPHAPYESYVVSQSQMKLTLDRMRHEPTYVYHYFNSNVGQKQIGLSAIQTGVPHTNLGILRGYTFPAPPVEEQRAIATALCEVDALIAGLERLIAKKRDIKQAAMQQLLTGQTRLPGFSGTWKLKRLGDCLVSHPDYGINSAAVEYSDRLPTYLRITDITEDGCFNPTPRVSVNSAASDQYLLSDGDVVFARTGASVGKSYRYRLTDGPLVFAGFLIRVRPDSASLNPKYLAAYATSEAYWNWVTYVSMRSGQPGINGNQLAQMPIELPPVAEQAAIEAVLSDMDAELATLDARLAKTQTLKQGMMQELLTGRTRLI
ncbi:restriction endonuclease subunit S [Massilia sp. YIM B02763]|uniref:restriction endonuclease subunit S n=1 Tax=Massilia sp. YIM B02763 TaxID=3050130 RepID=UPI0025B6EC97|nr:restriction endonuclease subunit S [Massilia sp. YIM B02763]MDN4054680.1 restriction endonuclease subunit S [Massilia sp. YIM B02763]